MHQLTMLGYKGEGDLPLLLEFLRQKMFESVEQMVWIQIGVTRKIRVEL